MYQTLLILGAAFIWVIPTFSSVCVKSLCSTGLIFHNIRTTGCDGGMDGGESKDNR